MEDCPTSLPDELILQIATCAGEVVPDEFVVRHPADGLDPLFTNGKIAPKQKWKIKWEEALTTRLNMMMVCRRFSQITTPVLYSSYFTTVPYQRDEHQPLLRFVSTIQKNPHLGKHIRRIDIVFGRYQHIPSADLAIAELVRLSPNLQILSIPILIDLNILPASLRSLQIKTFVHSWDIPQLDLLKALRRLECLERLSLRTNLTDSPTSPGAQVPVGHDEDSSSIQSHPSLRTVSFEANISDELLKGIISLGGIQSVQFRDGVPPQRISILSRAKCLTHLSFPQTWAYQIPINLSIPTLQHLHFTTYTSSEETDLDRLHTLGPITSIGRSVRKGDVQSTIDWLDSVIRDIESYQFRIPHKAKRIYTNRKSLRKMYEHIDNSRIREWVEQEVLGLDSGSDPSSRVEWYVQSGVEVTAVPDILDEIEKEPVAALHNYKKHDYGFI